MESSVEHYERREEVAESARKTVERVCREFGIDAELKETPEIISVCLKNTEGKIIRELGFMKMEHLPIGGASIPIERVLEARMRFPDLEIADAIAQMDKTTGA